MKHRKSSPDQEFFAQVNTEGNFRLERDAASKVDTIAADLGAWFCLAACIIRMAKFTVGAQQIADRV